MPKFISKFYLRRVVKTILLFVSLCIFKTATASKIILFKKDAVVWLPQQTVTGKLSGFVANQVTVYSNNKRLLVSVKKDSSFSFLINLAEEVNNIRVAAKNGDSVITSNVLKLSLGYHPLPVVKPYAVVHKNKVVLHAAVINNPADKPLQFLWSAGSKNPAGSKIRNSKESVASIPLPSMKGIYYFNLLVVAGKDTALFKTFIEKDNNTVTAFDMQTQYAGWINDAIIYEITPSYFVKKGTYDDITKKLPELKQLGINTIWLQPVYENSDGGQGYAVTDYFSLRTELGNKAQLKHLITAAKNLEMRVMFDFVPNHTSIHHPYAKDVIENGTSSHYFNFYQHKDDGVPYSSYYHWDKNGFVYYFWKNLINLNYDNEEVQQWMIEACKYWLKEFDIDGYRFDAVWGVNARCPQFAERLRTELKSIKPDLLMLAEDKGSDKHVYELGFDLAYDWERDTSWVSHWSWQYEYDPKDNLTIFNFRDADQRAAMLRKVLFQNDTFTNRRLRFMENNDLPRFITDHLLERTKMAAALLFSLPGVPMIYCGQEVGFQSPLYSGKPIFLADASIQSLNHDSLFNYYANLTRLRSSFSALRSKQMQQLSVNPSSTMVAFTRENNQQLFIIIINLDSKAADAKIDLSSFSFFNDKSKRSRLHDVLTTDSFSIKNKVTIPMKGYSTRWLLLQDESYLISNR